MALKPSDPRRYVRAPDSGTARRYIDLARPDAPSIARRQYLKLTQTGGLSLEKRAAARRAERSADLGGAPVPRAMSRYSTLLRERQALLAREEGGRPPSIGAIRKSPDMKDIVRDLRSPDKRPDGPLARALENIGRRPRGAPYAVGETPPKGGKGSGGRWRQSRAARANLRRGR